jgi:hypothetical protein
MKNPFKIKSRGKPTRCVTCQRYINPALSESIENKTFCGEGNYECSFKQEILEVVTEALTPIIRYINANEKFIKENQPIRVSWSVEKAEQLFLSNGLGEFSHQNFVEFIPDRPLTLELRAVNGPFETITKIDLEPEKPSITKFELDKDIVTIGSEINLNWDANGYKKIILNEEVDVSELSETKIQIDLPQDFITLNVLGHFGIKQSERKPIKVARVEEFNVKNNSEDTYELNWKTKHFQNITISDDKEKVFFNGQSESARIPIPSSDSDVNYFISGTTKYQDFYSQKLELKAVRIRQFRLKNYPSIPSQGVKKINLRLEQPGSGKENISSDGNTNYLVWENQPLDFEWIAENVNRTEIKDENGNLESNLELQPILANEKNRRYTITAYGDINSISKTIELKFVKIAEPKFDDIQNIKPDVPEINLDLQKYNPSIFSKYNSTNLIENIEKKLSNLTLSSVPEMEKQEEQLTKKIEAILKKRLNISDILRELNEDINQQLNNK